MQQELIFFVAMIFTFSVQFFKKIILHNHGSDFREFFESQNPILKYLMEFPASSGRGIKNHNKNNIRKNLLHLWFISVIYHFLFIASIIWMVPVSVSAYYIDATSSNEVNMGTSQSYA